MSGVFAVNREVWDHPMFAPEPFSEREAWIWMCGAAAYKPMRARCGRALVTLDRGQLAFATRFLARKWKWSEARVRRFLNRLEIDAAVTLQPTRETTLITICNYDKHQFSRRAGDSVDDLQIDAPATHPRRKEEELNKDKKEEEGSKKEVALCAPVDLSDWPADAFDQFWRKFPHRVGKLAAVEAFAKAKRAEPPWQKIISALDLYITSKPPDRAWCNPATWLNEGRWHDEPAANGGVNGFRGPRPLQDDAKSAGRAAGRLAEEARAGRFSFAPLPSLLPGAGGNDVRLLSEGRGTEPGNLLGFDRGDV